MRNEKEEGQPLKWLLLRYHLRRGIRFVTSQFMAWLLFGVSITLFSLILVPNLAHRMPFVGQWDYVLELEGTVYEKVGGPGGEVRTTPVAGASVAVGGYRVSTSAEGAYRLKFVARNLEDIPVFISVGLSEYIREVSFATGRFTAKQDFVIP